MSAVIYLLTMLAPRAEALPAEPALEAEAPMRYPGVEMLLAKFEAEAQAEADASQNR